MHFGVLSFISDHFNTLTFGLLLQFWDFAKLRPDKRWLYWVLVVGRYYFDEVSHKAVFGLSLYELRPEHVTNREGKRGAQYSATKELFYRWHNSIIITTLLQPAVLSKFQYNKRPPDLCCASCQFYNWWLAFCQPCLSTARKSQQFKQPL